MSRIRDIKRQIDAAAAAIETLDADLEAGHVSEGEHATKRAEREREAGRLLVLLRHAQREAREQDGAADRDERAERHAGRSVSSTAAPRWRSPAAFAIGATVLLVVGVGAGIGVARWAGGSRGVTTPAVFPGAPAGSLPGVMSDIELRALRQAADSNDASVPTLLQSAHAALDKGHLDEARSVYERVLRRDPRNVEAITHIGSVLYEEGRVDEAVAKDEEALRIDPRYMHALWDRTQYLFHAKRDYARTIQAAEAFLQVFPDGPDADNIRALMAQARAALKAVPANPR